MKLQRRKEGNTICTNCSQKLKRKGFTYCRECWNTLSLEAYRKSTIRESVLA